MVRFDALSYAALAFAIGLATHGVDHAIRGFDVVNGEVAVAGNVQLVAAMVTVVLVFLRHRFAPIAAVLLGAGSALGFSAAHLLPTWSAFSDSFVTPAPGAGVTAFSWLTALLEIGTALAFAVVAARQLRTAPAAA